jgi:hypothetical protein
MQESWISITGARQNSLKNIDVNQGFGVYIWSAPGEAWERGKRCEGRG